MSSILGPLKPSSSTRTCNARAIIKIIKKNLEPFKTFSDDGENELLSSTSRRTGACGKVLNFFCRLCGPCGHCQMCGHDNSEETLHFTVWIPLSCFCIRDSVISESMFQAISKWASSCQLSVKLSQYHNCDIDMECNSINCYHALEVSSI